MAPQVRTLDVLAEDPGSSSTAWWFTTIHTIVGDWMPSSHVLRQQAHIWCIDTHANKIPIYIK